MALCLLRGLVSALHVRIGSNSQVHLSANPPTHGLWGISQKMPPYAPASKQAAHFTTWSYYFLGILDGLCPV